MTTSCDQGYIDINKELELYRFEQLNQALFNNHPDAIYILDLEGRFKMVNEKVCDTVGLKREALIGNSYEMLIVKEYQALTAERFMLAKQDQPQRYETAVVTPNGIRYLDITNFPLKVENKIVATFGIAKDITEKKQREHELKEYAALLKAKNEELEVFRKVIAHDLRSPVTNSIGFAKLLEGGMLTAETEKEVKSLLLKSVESIDTMVRDLNEVIALKFVGTESKEHVRIQDSLNSLHEYFKCEIKEVNATLTLHVAPEMTLFTVRAYFESIMRNLISNALKYHTRQGLPSVVVKAEAVVEGVEISVFDNGIGMDMALVSDQIFKLHQRFAPAVAEGKGLGLYIVHEQVKLLGGTISVSSVLGSGTEFKIFIPIA